MVLRLTIIFNEKYLPHLMPIVTAIILMKKKSIVTSLAIKISIAPMIVYASRVMP